jgi:uncharacterized membrane protein
VSRGGAETTEVKTTRAQGTLRNPKATEEDKMLAIAGTGYGLIGILVIILLVVLIFYYLRRV